MLECKVSSWMFFTPNLKKKKKSQFFCTGQSTATSIWYKIFCSSLDASPHDFLQSAVSLKHNIWGVPLLTCAENRTKSFFPLTFLKIYIYILFVLILDIHSLTLFVFCFGDRTGWGWSLLMIISMAFDSKDIKTDFLKRY